MSSRTSVRFFGGRRVGLQWKQHHPLGGRGSSYPDLSAHILATEVRYTMHYPDVSEYEGTAYVAVPDLGLLMAWDISGRAEQFSSHQRAVNPRVIPCRGYWLQTEDWMKTNRCDICGESMQDSHVYYMAAPEFLLHCARCGLEAVLDKAFVAEVDVR